MKSTTIILITITLLWATNAFSAGPPVQYQFKGGDPASASQVNHNFQELADRIQELKDQRPNIDYHSYLTPENITTKIYSTSHIIVGTDPALCIETELTQKIERTTQGTDTLITETNTVLGSDPGQICSFYSYQYLATANALLRKKRMFYDSTRTTVVYEVIFNDDAPVLVNPMTVGKTWAEISSVTKSYPDNPPPEPGLSTFGKYTLVGIEPVTIPYDGGRKDSNPTTYSGCLKILRVAYSATVSTASGTATPKPILQVEWHCPGAGLVKYSTQTSTTQLTNMY